MVTTYLLKSRKKRPVDMPSGNMVLPKAGLRCFIEHLTFVLYLNISNSIPVFGNTQP